jgi:hypothetical protein
VPGLAQSAAREPRGAAAAAVGARRAVSRVTGCALTGHPVATSRPIRARMCAATAVAVACAHRTLVSSRGSPAAPACTGGAHVAAAQRKRDDDGARHARAHTQQRGAPRRGAFQGGAAAAAVFVRERMTWQ